MHEHRRWVRVLRRKQLVRFVTDSTFERRSGDHHGWMHAVLHRRQRRLVRRHRHAVRNNPGSVHRDEPRGEFRMHEHYSRVSILRLWVCCHKPHRSSVQHRHRLLDELHYILHRRVRGQLPCHRIALPYRSTGLFQVEPRGEHCMHQYPARRGVLRRWRWTTMRESVHGAEWRFLFQDYRCTGYHTSPARRAKPSVGCEL